jgi:hypothetical protein
MYTKFATINLNTDRRGQNPAAVFVAQPTPTQENLAGRLFILIEVAAKKNDALKIINFIIDDINESYYQNEKIILREKIDTLKIENIFETVLVRTNKNLLDFLIREKVQIAPASINATIGIVYEDQLHFANIGKNKALLLYKDDAGDSEYRLINVERSAAANEEPNLKKLFSSIISGDMPNKSYFIFANEALAEYLFNKDLIEIITKLAPLGAAEQIKNTLAHINTYIPFVGIIIKNNSQMAEESDYREESALDYRRSYPPVVSTAPAIKQLSGQTPAASLRAVEQKTEQILLSGPRVSGRQVSYWFGRGFKKLNPFPPLGKLIKAIFEHRDSADNPPPISGLDKKILLGEKPKKSLASKILLIILLAVVLLFVGNLIYKKMQNAKTVVVEKNKSQADIIVQKESQVEACLLYKSDCSADIKELQNIFNEITAEDKKTMSDYDSLWAKFNELTGKVQKITKVDNLKEVANFASISGEAKPENIKLIGGNAKIIYAADNNKKVIYKINLSTKITAILTSDKIISYLNYPIIDKTGAIYYLDNKQIIQLDPKTDRLNVIKFNYDDKQNILGIATYNGRLYALDKANNQIYRYSLLNNVYNQGEARLKDSLDMSSVVSFAIDTTGAQSDVYFLKSGGEVAKYYDGKNLGFKLDGIEPVCKNAAKILILKNLYILDPENKRLAVFDKNGKFIKQYQSDKLTNPKDFFVDESGKKAYFLNDRSIYEIGL